MRTREDGSFPFANLPAVSYHLQVTQFGFSSESTTVVVAAGGATPCAIKLRAVALSLERVLVVAPRMGETQAAALGAQKAADNEIDVMPGDVIRALPNYNAAEAAGRMGDVSLERDEGEGKFVQIRGTEPRLSSVTVNGVLVPGTQVGDRITKLDDVPSDLLGAIIISKTLTADMDAEAIGGSIDLETKTPEGAPRGYVSAQGGHITLESRDVGQGEHDLGWALRRRPAAGVPDRREHRSDQPPHQRRRARLGRRQHGPVLSTGMEPAQLRLLPEPVRDGRRLGLSV